MTVSVYFGVIGKGFAALKPAEEGMEVIAQRITTFGGSRSTVCDRGYYNRRAWARDGNLLENVSLGRGAVFFFPERKRPYPILPEVIGFCNVALGCFWVIRDIFTPSCATGSAHWCLMAVAYKGAKCAAVVAVRAICFNCGVARPDSCSWRGGRRGREIYGFQRDRSRRAAAAFGFSVILAGRAIETDTTLIDFCFAGADAHGCANIGRPCGIFFVALLDGQRAADGPLRPGLFVAISVCAERAFFARCFFARQACFFSVSRVSGWICRRPALSFSLKAKVAFILIFCDLVRAGA